MIYYDEPYEHGRISNKHLKIPPTILDDPEYYANVHHLTLTLSFLNPMFSSYSSLLMSAIFLFSLLRSCIMDSISLIVSIILPWMSVEFTPYFFLPMSAPQFHCQLLLLILTPPLVDIPQCSLYPLVADKILDCYYVIVGKLPCILDEVPPEIMGAEIWVSVLLRRCFQISPVITVIVV